MIIKFKTFNRGQHSFEFDMDSLKPDETLDEFLLNTDQNGDIYIIKCYYPHEALKNYEK